MSWAKKRIFASPVPRKTRSSVDDLRRVLKRLGFEERIRGDHHIFSRSGVEEILNLQPRNSRAKAYQVKQVRNVIVQYNLAEEQDAG